MLVCNTLDDLQTRDKNIVENPIGQLKVVFLHLAVNAST